MIQKYDHSTSKHVYDFVTGDETWIYTYEPESKQQSIVWVFQDKRNPTKVAHARSTSKQMIVSFFFWKTGHVAIVPLKQHRTVNSEWYTTICLSVVFQLVVNRRTRVTLHSDNAGSHTSTQTTTFLSTQTIDFMSHPPNSTDLATNNFFLFSYVKNKMRGQRFSTPWRYLNQNGKSASTIGSNACKSV